jgi:hypothetical protein
MKAILTGMLAMMMVGCATQPSQTGVKIGEGEYDITIPAIQAICTNTPRLWVYECGRLRIETLPYGSNVRLETWIDWPEGSVNTTVFSNDVPVKTWSGGIKDK